MYVLILFCISGLAEQTSDCHTANIITFWDFDKSSVYTLYTLYWNKDFWEEFMAFIFIYILQYIWRDLAE
jgi:hypothetical protein